MSDELSKDLASLRITPSTTQPTRSGGLALLLRRSVKLWPWLLGIAAVFVWALPRIEASFFLTEVEATEIVRVSPASMGSDLTASGYIIPQLLSKVGAKVAGKVARVAVSEGEPVKKGDTLLMLDSADEESAVKAGRARVALAEAEAEKQRVQWEELERTSAREQALAQAGVTGQAGAENARAQAHALKASYQAAQAALQASKAELSTRMLTQTHLNIVAPINGVVLTKPPEVGEMVSPTSGPLLEVADFDTLMAEVEVPEGRLFKVSIGAPAEIMLDAFPAKRFRGEVKDINPVVNRAKATVVVKVAFAETAEGVLPNMAARAVFLRKEDIQNIGKPAHTVVPESAVVQREGKPHVFVIEGSKAVLTPVVLGEAFGPGFVLQQGPQPGVRVVQNPPSSLVHLQRIKERITP